MLERLKLELAEWLGFRAGYAAGMNTVDGGCHLTRDEDQAARRALPGVTTVGELARWYMVLRFGDVTRAAWNELRREAWRHSLEREEFPYLEQSFVERLMEAARS